MNAHLSIIRAKMAEVAKSNGLPEFYPDDLKADYRALEAFQGQNFVWLLRTCGTVLLPIGIGADPVFVDYWLESNHGQRIMHFFVDTAPRAKQIVRGITFEEASLLANQAPVVRRGVDSDAYAEDVNDVLRRGCQLGIWGAKAPGTADSIGFWPDWIRFFEASDNAVMSRFVRKALRVVESESTRQTA